MFRLSPPRHYPRVCLSNAWEHWKGNGQWLCDAKNENKAQVSHFFKSFLWFFQPSRCHLTSCCRSLPPFTLLGRLLNTIKTQGTSLRSLPSCFIPGGKPWHARSHFYCAPDSHPCFLLYSSSRLFRRRSLDHTNKIEGGDRDSLCYVSFWGTNR